MSKKKYIDIREYWDDRYPYQFFVGGRGSGKTYSGLGMVVEKQRDDEIDKFVYMRRTGEEIEACIDSRLRGEFLNPFKSINNDFGYNYGIMPYQKKCGAIHMREYQENGTVELKSDMLGYGVALSTISGIRGVDMTDADVLIYDEFIPERHVRSIKSEGEAFLNCIETIARNRELRGKKPMKVFCFANAFNIHNAIFMELGLISAVERLINRGQEHYYDNMRGLGVHLLKNTDEFMADKAASSLGRLTRGTRWSDMALSNDFVYNDFSLIGYKNVKGMRPCITIDEVTMWEKKGDGMLYFSYCTGKCPKIQTTMEHERRYFMQQYGHYVLQEFVKGNTYFECYAIKQKMLDLLRISR